MSKFIVIGVGVLVVLGIGGYLLNRPATEPVSQELLDFDPGVQQSDTNSSTTSTTAPGSQDSTATRDTTITTTCKEVVPSEILVAAIPRSVGTYKAKEEPTGGTVSLPGSTAQLSTASATLTGPGDFYVNITIQDICFVPQLKTAWDLMGSFQSADVSNTRTTISGFGAWEQVLTEDGSYKYAVMIKNRVIVSVDGSEGTPGLDVRRVAEAVGYVSIEEALK